MKSYCSRPDRVLTVAAADAILTADFSGREYRYSKSLIPFSTIEF